MVACCTCGPVQHVLHRLLILVTINPPTNQVLLAYQMILNSDLLTSIVYTFPISCAKEMQWHRADKVRGHFLPEEFNDRSISDRFCMLGHCHVNLLVGLLVGPQHKPTKCSLQF